MVGEELAEAGAVGVGDPATQGDADVVDATQRSVVEVPAEGIDPVHPKNPIQPVEALVNAAAGCIF